MKKLLFILSILLVSIYLVGCCNFFGSLAPQTVPIFVWSDSAKKATICYYDNGNKTETVSLPFFIFAKRDHCAPGSDKFFLQICDTSADFYGIIGYFPIGDSCSSLEVMQHNSGLFPNITKSTNIAKRCWKISNDSLLKIAKKIEYPGYLEIKKGSTGGCQTATPN